MGRVGKKCHLTQLKYAKKIKLSVFDHKFWAYLRTQPFYGRKTFSGKKRDRSIYGFFSPRTYGPNIFFPFFTSRSKHFFFLSLQGRSAGSGPSPYRPKTAFRREVVRKVDLGTSINTTRRALHCGQHPESLFGNWLYIR